MPRRLPAVYDPVNGKLYGEDPIRGLLEVATGGGGGGGSVTIANNVTDILSSSGSTISADSGTGDKIVFWDESEVKLTYLNVGPGLNLIGNTLSSDIQGSITLTVENEIGDIFSASSSGYNATFTADSAGSDKIVFWDQSANKLTYLTVGSGLTLSGTTLSVPAVNTDLVTDTTPQLGGNLDVNGQDIITTSNGDIDLDPHGSGSVVAKGNSTRGAGEIVLNCEFNSHGVTLKGPAHSAGATYTFTLPPNAGTNTYLLQTNGSGSTSWVAPPPVVTTDNSSSDVISVNSGVVSFDDAGADKLLFWDDSESKARYLTLGANISITSTTLEVDTSATAIAETSQVINTNYTLGSGKNGHSVGPVEVASGYTVTIPNNAIWLVH